MADYTRLAALMASHKELALFRKFAKLNTKCLLHMQSELIHLEAELENIELENGHSGDSEKLAFQVSVFDLKRSSGTQKDLQWRKALEIREKLKHYNEALLRYVQVENLETPSERHLHLLKEWLDRSEGGDFFLRGREAGIWEQEKDTVALAPPKADKDSISWWISNKIIPWYHYHWGHRAKKYRSAADEDWNGVWHYGEEGLVMLANATSTFISSMLPTTSILVLYFIKAPLARLGLMMAFTTLFSVTLALVARARRVDVFAATTAFAAVQVVFLGGTGFCNP